MNNKLLECVLTKMYCWNAGASKISWQEREMLVGVRRCGWPSAKSIPTSRKQTRVWIFGISSRGSATNAEKARGARAPKGPRGAPLPRTHNTHANTKDKERESDDECLNACSTNKMESPPAAGCKQRPKTSGPAGPARPRNHSGPRADQCPRRTHPRRPSGAPPPAPSPRRHFKRDPRDTKISSKGPALGPRGAHGHPGRVPTYPACPRGGLQASSPP